MRLGFDKRRYKNMKELLLNNSTPSGSFLNTYDEGYIFSDLVDVHNEYDDWKQMYENEITYTIKSRFRWNTNSEEVNEERVRKLHQDFIMRCSSSFDSHIPSEHSFLYLIDEVDIKNQETINASDIELWADGPGGDD